MARNYENLYINGRWVAASAVQKIDVINPSTDELIAEVATASIEDVDDAVRAAHDAFPRWAATSSTERGRLIQAVADRMIARQSDLTAIVSSELGMPAHLTLPIQVEGPAEGMASYTGRAALMDKIDEEAGLQIVREPIGVCALITPWNYPLHQIVGKVAPALAAGCTMILKPSEVTPINAILFAEILDEVGIPPGVFNLVQGMGLPVGEALVTHKLVDMVSFTGSTNAGVRITAATAEDVKRVCLELGGKSPYIITDDADYETAIKYGVEDVMINSGQTCTALTRMLLPTNRYEEGVKIAKDYTESLKVGRADNAEAFVGPVSSELQRKRVLGMISRGIDGGARLVTGGLERPEGLEKGSFVRPTIFADVSNDMEIAREEIFGPVLSILPYDSLDQAIQIANDSPYGLSSAVWAQTAGDAVQIGRQLRAGLVHINGATFNYEAPFGGYKRSGNGREWADEGLAEFVEIKSILFKGD